MEQEEELNGPHQWPNTNNKFVKGCVKCGHVPLTNRISELVTKIGCGYHKHPAYKAWVDKGCKF
jgi:Zn ribbon nucleic-acid-binding protein